MLRYILLTIGAIFVLAGVALLFTWYGQARKAPEVAGGPTEIQTSIMTVAHVIPKGTLLRQDDLKSKNLGPEEHLQPGSVVPGQEKDLLGALSRRDFAEGEPLIASDFIKPSDRNFLSAVLKPGSRAISIFVDPAQSVAGLALQGDYVDVILIQSFEDKITVDPGRKTVGETVLHSVRVIAIDQTLAPPQGSLMSAVMANAEGRVPKTITLEVTERQAEKLMVSQKLGGFQLTLLPLTAAAANPIEDERNAKPVWASDVSLALDEVAQRQPVEIGGPPAKAGAPQPPPPAPCPPSTGSTLDKSVRCAPSTLTYYRAPMPSNSKPGEAPPQNQSPATRAPPVSLQERGRYD
ncbi:MAG: Flp pilus assembly protein CpaB [Roseiarcus sp.]